MVDEAPAQLTLADIARLAGVSRSAASRALDVRAPVRGPGADRVREIAARHGYVPNAAAANLRLKRTGLVAVVVPRLTDTVMAMLYESIVTAAAERGYQATVMTTDDDPRKEVERGRALLKQRVDGFILTTARTDGADPFLLELKERRIPFSLALREDGESMAAVIDDELGGRLAVEHLLANGHRRIAFIGGPAYASTSQGRERGYRRAMADAGIDILAGYVRHSDFSVESGYAIAQELIALAAVPTAVFTANDSLALGVMTAAQRAGIAVPDGLSIVGYNDTPLAPHLAKPLTSVAVPFPIIAERALGILLDGGGPAPEPAAPHLVVRGSVASLI
ncbi:LacI family DNA-binding transcriptional regulator [Microbacterium gilvum]|uniref:LacI family DNA-binding transcriptional regulator n=1 Tax=Microbacterium gilvum TaxID=1336204 RepID=A0ABP8ZYR2_9MICO